MLKVFHMTAQLDTKSSFPSSNFPNSLERELMSLFESCNILWLLNLVHGGRYTEPCGILLLEYSIQRVLTLQHYSTSKNVDWHCKHVSISLGTNLLSTMLGSRGIGE